jgi:hypothetical protein
MDIPVSFHYEGKHYKALLRPISGAASTLFSLMINNYYNGQLQFANFASGARQDENIHYYRFTSQTGKFEELEDYFADVVIAWYE